MYVKFNGPKRINKILYPQGVSQVPADLSDNWYFQALLADGEISIIDTQREAAMKAKVLEKAERDKDKKKLFIPKESPESFSKKSQGVTASAAK